MRWTTILLALASLTAISGHSLFTTLFIDDQNQGDATCIRMPMNPARATFPIIDLASNDMACNVNGSTGVARVCTATQGSRLTFAWRYTANVPQSPPVDISHKGPCAVYMKKVNSAIKDPGNGGGWFKIYDFSKDPETQEWCTEKLIKAGGLLTATIPSDLAGGYYLVRPELLSLHEASPTANGGVSQPQFYAGCAQIYLNSTATGAPSNTVSIPGYVKQEDPSMNFDIYVNRTQPYPMYGPSVSTINTSNSRVRLKSRTALKPQAEGLKPTDCTDENANWCGIELAPYSTEKDCWAQADICWKQLDGCFGSAPPTGHAGCTNWESQKCQPLADSCSSSKTGPPNQNKILTPPKYAHDLSKAFGRQDLKADVPGVATSAGGPSQVPSSSVVPSSAVTSTSVVAASAVLYAMPGASYSMPDDSVTTIAASSPGMVNHDKGVDIVYVTKTRTVVNTIPCATHTAAKRQVFQFVPDPDGSSSASAVTPAVSAATSPSSSPAGPASGEAAAASASVSVSEPLFNFKESSGSDTPSSISVATRPIVPTVDGSCGQVAGYMCEYESILGTIQGCCSQYGYCGYSPAHCGAECQVGYGRCDEVPSKAAKRYDADLLPSPDTTRVGFVATVTMTPMCSTPTGATAFSDAEIAEAHRLQASLWSTAGRTLTVDAPFCTPSSTKSSTRHFHRHLHPLRP